MLTISANIPVFILHLVFPPQEPMLIEFIPTTIFRPIWWILIIDCFVVIFQVLLMWTKFEIQNQEGPQEEPQEENISENSGEQTSDREEV
jgi:protein-S-isoprenylcysteine O-methyltransferase Ste14